MKTLNKEKFLLKIATSKDLNFIWNLRSQKTTLEWFQRIKFNDHINWFKRKSNYKKNIFLIAKIGKKKIGYLRFSFLKTKYPDISYFIKEDFQGKGHGKNLLIEASRNLFKKKSKIKKIIAHVDINNIVSIKCFKKAGFIQTKHDSKFIYFKISRSELHI